MAFVPRIRKYSTVDRRAFYNVMRDRLKGLEPEQVALFEQLAEATRAVADRREREPFYLIRTLGKSVVKGNGFSGEVVAGDLETLAERGVLRIQDHTRHGFSFIVPPEGFDAYRFLKLSADSQVENVERGVTSYIDSDEFKARHPESFRKWNGAASLLWSSDPEDELSTIGLKCREAIQAFLTERFAAEDVEPKERDPQKTVDRLREQIAHHRSNLGSAKSELLDALVVYWGTTSDLVQRQVHSAEREAEDLTWEDARMVVFQTMVLMYEVDRVL